MPGFPLHGRDEQLGEIERLLDALAHGPSALALQGEAGIGRTTLVHAAVARARERGMHVLSCSGSRAEADLPFVALADLLEELDAGRLAALPAPERAALDAVLLRAHAPGAEPDPAAVAAGLRALVEQLADERPLLLAVDDAQWLDPASADALAHCARGLRLDSRAGLVVGWLLGEPHAWAPPLADWRHVRVVRLGPLDDAALDAILRQHAPARDRRTLARVAAAAEGNPGVALELLRALPDGEPEAGAPLPLSPALRARVAARLEGAGAELEELLLAVACLGVAELDVLAAALGPDAHARAERACALGLLVRDGPRVRLASRLLAAGVLGQAGPVRRRALHRRLAEVVADPEPRARQLALGAVLPDALPALEAAARDARARGECATAAELIELALALEPDDAGLRIRAAEHHLDAGDGERAQALLDAAIVALPAGDERAGALVLAAELALRDAELAAAQALLERAQAEAGADLPLRVAAGVRLAVVLGWRGEAAEAAAVAAAAVALPAPHRGLLAQALAVSATAGFALGEGVDEARLQRALALEDPALRTPAWLRPALLAAAVLERAGRVDEAAGLLHRLSDEPAQPDELGWIAAGLAGCEQQRGDLTAAARAVAPMERKPAAAEVVPAERLQPRRGTVGSPHGHPDPPPATAHLLALTARARLAAHTGRAAEARAAAQAALALATACGWQDAVVAQHATLGALELSADDAQAAATRLGPLAGDALAAGLPEPSPPLGAVVADACEALVLVGRIEQAEPLAALLERRGRALQRTGTLAVATRCHALLLAATGDVAGAERELRRALAAHDRGTQPLERARCLLALGRVTRRQRRRGAAAQALEQALAGFEAAGARLWAARARDELAALGRRTGRRTRGAGAPDALTAAEARVARLAASGLTNRQVASALQISAKTVDAHLGRVYRKLEIHSRAELGARIGGPGLRRVPSPR
jgi:DNA-binding CsgD family transcriptional regulator/tetratricopeptide (TPR) repeat protein